MTGVLVRLPAALLVCWCKEPTPMPLFVKVPVVATLALMTVGTLICADPEPIINGAVPAEPGTIPPAMAFSVANAVTPKLPVCRN